MKKHVMAITGVAVVFVLFVLVRNYSGIHPDLQPTLPGLLLVGNYEGARPVLQPSMPFPSLPPLPSSQAGHDYGPRRPTYPADVPLGVMPEIGYTHRYNTFRPLEENVGGTEIHSAKILNALLVSIRYSSVSHNIRAFEYGELIYAEVGPKDGGGWQNVFKKENGGYRPILQTQGSASCVLYTKFNAPVGLMCRFGGECLLVSTTTHRYTIKSFPECWTYK
ncbi:MAG: hypothetical protein Q7S01_04610 [bacterium]|nr:hypothetical protein [bacterium]